METRGFAKCRLLGILVDLGGAQEHDSRLSQVWGVFLSQCGWGSEDSCVSMGERGRAGHLQGRQVLRAHPHPPPCLLSCFVLFIF